MKQSMSAAITPLRANSLSQVSRHLSHRIFEDWLTVLVNKVHLLVHSFVARRMQAAATRHIQRASAGTIHLVFEVNQAHAIFGRLQNDGPARRRQKGCR